jgi:hypothetical protein
LNISGDWLCGQHKEKGTKIIGYVVIEYQSISSLWAAGRENIHCKKRLAIFLSPAGTSRTKLSLPGNNLIIPGQDELG